MRNARVGEQAQGIYDPRASKDILDDPLLPGSVTAPRLSDNSEGLQPDNELEVIALCHALQLDIEERISEPVSPSPARRYVRIPLDECNEDDYDEDDIDNATSLHGDYSADNDDDWMSTDDALPEDDGWDIFHPYFGNRRIKLLDITRSIGSAALPVLLEYEANPGLDNLEPFILHNINIMAHEWTLVLETHITGRLLLTSAATVRGIYAIVPEDDYY